MSGVLALLDDVAAIAKLAAAQLDDVAAQTAKAGTKAAGVLIDDAAVTPKYVSGLPAARELPIVWKIARGSLFNKLVILTPAALALNAFAPWLLPPLLILGGAYLCFEGAEKVWSLLAPRLGAARSPAAEAAAPKARGDDLSAAHLEERRVRGAIKTDFILSAEIMAISLSVIETGSLLTEALTLVAVALLVTVAVYGTVALLVKADDVGLALSRTARIAALRAAGRWLVAFMPRLLAIIAAVGTAAMLWVGGSIVIHSLQEMGWREPYEAIAAAAATISGSGAAAGFGRWLITALLDGLLGLALGLVMIPVAHRLIEPLAERLGGGGDAGAP